MGPAYQRRGTRRMDRSSRACHRALPPKAGALAPRQVPGHGGRFSWGTGQRRQVARRGLSFGCVFPAVRCLHNARELALLSALARVPSDSLRWVEVRAGILQERSRTTPKRPAIRCRDRSASLGPHLQRRTGDCAQAVADATFSVAQFERSASIHEVSGPESPAAVSSAAQPGGASRPASDAPNRWIGVLQMRRGVRDSASESGCLAKACSILAARRLLLPLDTRWRRTAALNAFGHTARDRGAGGIRRRSYRFLPSCPGGRSAVGPALELHA